MNSVTVFSPAKLNLFLAATGRRTDGFHDLVSLVAPVDWGDRLMAEVGSMKDEVRSGDFSLECTDPAVPVDGSNLVLKAARAFREATGWESAVSFHLEKRIPMGAGLGGGSSNAVAALRALDSLAGEPLDAAALSGLAASLGSDCSLFLHGGPVVMRGRGERIDPLPAAAANRLRGRRVLIFKPDFGISTPWAYAAMAGPGAAAYLAEPAAEARLAAWLGDPDAPVGKLLFNNLEPVAFAKYIALPALLKRLASGFGLAPLMSGSGSACFAIIDDATPHVHGIAAAIREAWGASALVIETLVG